MQHYDVIVIGAGAAGLMCAITAGQRGRSVLVLDHTNKVGKKILMAGGGRCNFTNIYSTPDNFLSHNLHFCKSALSRYSPYDFIDLVEKHGIAYHEKKLGQLFCDHSSKDITKMLLAECEAANVTIRLNTEVRKVVHNDTPTTIRTNVGEWTCQSLVIATGGLSIPTLGASGFGYDLAKQLGLAVYPTRAGLVPFTLDEQKKQMFKDLSGISVDAEVSANGQSFRENILFTHRGISGPAILQISSFWQPGDTVEIDLMPDCDLVELLKQARDNHPKQQLSTFLGRFWAKRMADCWCEHFVPNKPLAELSNQDIETVIAACQPWQLKPASTEGYRTAEVTLGGVNTDAISSQSFACHDYPDIYFIGEVLDVTGHLGGHNFQWAWASGHAAGSVV